MEENAPILNKLVI